MKVFTTYKDRPKRGCVINESFNFRPKTQKSIKDELKKNGVPDDWFPFLRDVFLSFSDNKDVMAFEIKPKFLRISHKNLKNRTNYHLSAWAIHKMTT